MGTPSDPGRSPAPVRRGCTHRFSPGQRGVCRRRTLLHGSGGVAACPRHPCANVALQRLKRNSPHLRCPATIHSPTPVAAGPSSRPSPQKSPEPKSQLLATRAASRLQLSSARPLNEPTDKHTTAEERQLRALEGAARRRRATCLARLVGFVATGLLNSWCKAGAKPVVPQQQQTAAGPTHSLCSDNSETTLLRDNREASWARPRPRGGVSHASVGTSKLQHKPDPLQDVVVVFAWA